MEKKAWASLSCRKALEQNKDFYVNDSKSLSYNNINNIIININNIDHSNPKIISQL